MTQLQIHKTGIAFGILMGIWHFFWSLLVALGIAKPILDFILALHFLNFSFEIREFNLLTAMSLIGITSLIGYTMGIILALIWNKLFSEQS